MLCDQNQSCDQILQCDMASPPREASNSLCLMTLYKQKERPFTKKECCRVESWRKDTLWKPMCLIWGCVCVYLCAHICRYLHWAVLWHIRAECEPQAKTIRRCFDPISWAVYFNSVAKITYILGYYWKKVTDSWDFIVFSLLVDSNILFFFSILVI